MVRVKWIRRGTITTDGMIEARAAGDVDLVDETYARNLCMNGFCERVSDPIVVVTGLVPTNEESEMESIES